MDYHWLGERFKNRIWHFSKQAKREGKGNKQNVVCPSNGIIRRWKGVGVHTAHARVTSQRHCVKSKKSDRKATRRMIPNTYVQDGQTSWRVWDAFGEVNDENLKSVLRQLYQSENILKTVELCKRDNTACEIFLMTLLCKTQWESTNCLNFQSTGHEADCLYEEGIGISSKNAPCSVNDTTNIQTASPL